MDTYTNRQMMIQQSWYNEKLSISSPESYLTLNQTENVDSSVIQKKICKSDDIYFLQMISFLVIEDILQNRIIHEILYTYFVGTRIEQLFSIPLSCTLANQRLLWQLVLI